MTEMVPIQEVKEKEHVNDKNQEKMEELKEPMRDGKSEYQEEDIEMLDSLLLGKKQTSVTYTQEGNKQEEKSNLMQEMSLDRSLNIKLIRSPLHMNLVINKVGS